ncbi:NAD(P)-binding domain-containing protein [Streptomyces griseoloalbus]|uniref:NADPH-dependent F420 reductase n=1 Tax=Streptomyces griseoloalbus TaxID=67303 RepID=UPI0033B773BE
MRIGILGTGAIGAELARIFSAGGHEVAVANSRGPETIDADVLQFGAQAVTAADAVQGRDVVILSVPFFKVPEVAGLFASVPDETVVIDTTNYVPVGAWNVPSRAWVRARPRACGCPSSWDGPWRRRGTRSWKAP